MIHHPSGARGESREERSQLQNKKAAFLRMIDTPQFKLWLRIETGRIAAFEDSFTIPANEVKIEVRVGGKWTEVPASALSN